MDEFTFPEEKETGQFEDLLGWPDSLFFEWKPRSNIKRVRCAKPQAQGSDIRVIVELTDGTSYTMTQDELEAEINSETVTYKARGRFAANDIWFHRNRNGRWAIATGQEPAIWPEDEVG